jgi:hypothetical protein
MQSVRWLLVGSEIVVNMVAHKMIPYLNFAQVEQRSSELSTAV